MLPRTPRSRPALPEDLTGSGDILLSGSSAGGQQILDARAKGFLARITAQPDDTTGAYGFARVDEGDATFPVLDGDAAVFGDGIMLAAYEQTGRTDVPADGSAVVWLEPLRGGVGYSFEYVPRVAAPVVYSAALAADFDVIAAGSLTTWRDVTGVSLDLPAGTYRVYGKAGGEIEVTTLNSYFLTFLAQLTLASGGDVFGSEVIMARVDTVGKRYNFSFAIVCPPITLTAPDTLKLQTMIDDDAGGISVFTVGKLERFTFYTDGGNFIVAEKIG